MEFLFGSGAVVASQLGEQAGRVGAVWKPALQRAAVATCTAMGFQVETPCVGIHPVAPIEILEVVQPIAAGHLRHRVAVDFTLEFQPLATCPRFLAYRWR